jgi:hypothetical protein
MPLKIKAVYVCMNVIYTIKNLSAPRANVFHKSSYSEQYQGKHKLASENLVLK